MRKKRRQFGTGQRFGKLTLLHTINTKHNCTMWLCVCDCGKKKEISAGHLGRSVNSCGCMRAENRKNLEEKREKRYKDISGKYWSSIKHAAKRRNVPFSLTLEEAWDVWVEQKGQCAISGIALRFSSNSNQETIIFEQTASLDRKNSKLGYTKENIQWIHKRINEMKNDDSDEEFIEWCKTILDYQFRKIS